MTKAGTFTAQQLLDLRNAVLLFDAEHQRWLNCERADAESDVNRRSDLRKSVVEAGLLWRPSAPTRQEIDLLYGMVREATRIALARRSAEFQVKYGITLSCGIEPSTES